MATGTGLDAQVGFKLESTYGTAVTVDKFQEFNSESLAWEPTWLEPSALRVGTKFKRVGRVVQSRQTVSRLRRARALDPQHGDACGSWRSVRRSPRRR
jgi:hypothetical protein